MKAEILRKLNQALTLSDSDVSEAWVIYVLIQIGKVLEPKRHKQNKRKRFPSLVFYRNWIAHATLDTSAKSLLNEIADTLDDRPRLEKLLRKRIAMQPLKKELVRFLLKHGLPQQLVTDQAT